MKESTVKMLLFMKAAETNWCVRPTTIYISVTSHQINTKIHVNDRIVHTIVPRHM